MGNIFAILGKSAGINVANINKLFVGGKKLFDEWSKQIAASTEYTNNDGYVILQGIAACNNFVNYLIIFLNSH